MAGLAKLGADLAARDSQLHLTQGELEQISLDKRQLAADADKVKIELVGRIAILQAEVQQQADKLVAGAEAMTQKVNAEQVANAELASRAEALKKAQAGEQALTQALQTKASELATAGKQREVDVAGLAKLGADLATREQALKEAKEALAKAQADLASRAEALKNALTSEQALTQELQTKAGELATAGKQREVDVAGLAQLGADLATREQSLKEAKEALAKAQTELASRAEALKKAQASEQALTQELQAKEQALAKAQQLSDVTRQQISELTGQYDSQLLQLHQTQEELEQIFLDRRQQAADAEKAQAELAGRIASLQAEVKQQADKLVAGAAAMVQKVNAEQAANADLDRLKSELVSAQAEFKKLGTELQSRDKTLKQSQDALAKAQAELTSRSEALKKAQTAQHQLNQELQTKLAALAVAEQLVDQGLVQHKAVESENELLLLRLHEVQEDMERYFLENRQLQQVMGQTHHSLDRARHLISRLMLPAREPAMTLQAGAAAPEGSVTARP